MKIKIDKKVWLIVGIIIFLIALVGLVRTYSQQVNEQQQLKTSLEAHQALLHKLTTDKQDLENKRAQAESLLETSRLKFPESVESIEYGEDLFKIAKNCNVELTSLSPSMPTTRTAGAVTYSVSSFTILVQGHVDNVLKFINALRTGDGFRQAWAAEVHSIDIDFGDTELATISVDIYGYKG